VPGSNAISHDAANTGIDTMENVSDFEVTESIELVVPGARSGRKIHPVAITALLAVAVVAAVFGLALARASQTQPTDGKAPDFALTTFTGETITPASLRGKIVVLNFWASWCGPCRDEAPALEAAWQKYKSKGVVFVGVAYTDTERAALAFIKEFGTTFPNGLDLGTRISTTYRITGVPETFFIDREGNITQFMMYPLNQSILSSVLDRMLASGGA
jgi:cytochrome c biogenesis protein CcmG, thiol:disulfide interchange protein DsbE